jgi:hypothetical protein
MHTRHASRFNPRERTFIGCDPVPRTQLEIERIHNNGSSPFLADDSQEANEDYASRVVISRHDQQASIYVSGRLMRMAAKYA